LIKFTIPVLLSYWFQQLYYIFDWMIIGRFLGASGLAVVGAPSSIFFLVNGIIQGLSLGFVLIIAKRGAHHDYRGVKQSLATSLMLSMIITIPLMIILLSLIHPLLMMQSVEASMFDQIKLYVTLMFIGLPISILNWLISNMLRALGQTK